MQSSPRFYLGYLRGRNFPPPPAKKKCPASPQKVLFNIFTVYSICNYSISEKSSRLDEVSAHGTVPFLKIVSQNQAKCTRLLLSAYSFQKMSGGHAPYPSRKIGTSATSPRNDKS